MAYLDQTLEVQLVAIKISGSWNSIFEIEHSAP